MLPHVITYWHDHVQVPNPWTLFSLDLQQHKLPCLWLWDSTQRFQITINDDLDATTMFYECLIVVLASVDSFVIRRYKTSQISQRVTHKSSKSLQMWLGFPFYMWRSLNKTLNVFTGLGLFKNSAKNLDLQFSINWV